MLLCGLYTNVTGYCTDFLSSDNFLRYQWDNSFIIIIHVHVSADIMPIQVAVYKDRGINARNPVFGVCDQARLKPVCMATETS